MAERTKPARKRKEPVVPALAQERAPLFSPAWLVPLGLFAPMLLTVMGAFRVRAFTIDDAYISFRYARNLANGDGLVYNLGERVEGYTNFLWTVLIALATRLGGAPQAAAKGLGLACACGALFPTYLLSERLRPFRDVPCLATWLLATSMLFTGYAVFGLEGPLFLLLVLSGTELFQREIEAEAKGAQRLPFSGLVFALAALTRPEAPLFLGLLTLWQGRRMLSRQSLSRLGMFAGPVAMHLAFRRVYYGAWVPNTLTAKTGDLSSQLVAGHEYLVAYATHLGPIVFCAIASIATSIASRRKLGLAIASIALSFALYVAIIGGDWMPYFRFLAPAEPFLFLLIDDAARGLFETGRERSPRAPRDMGVVLFAVAFALICGVIRLSRLREAQSLVLAKEKAFWDDAAGRTAAWLVANGEPGPIGIADLGYVGFETNQPIVDMLGLLVPEVAKLSGAYTRKVGPGFTDAIFARDPKYFVIISSTRECKNATIPSGVAIIRDARFKAYRLLEPIVLKGGGAWCIWGK